MDVEENLDECVYEIQQMLLNKEFKTSTYRFFNINERGKIREIADLQYYPDRIVHWALIRVLEPIFLSHFIYFTYAAIPKRGTHRALTRLHRWMKEDEKGTKYCLKMDVSKFFPSIDKEILKNQFRKVIKDNNSLWLMDEIVDSYPKSGIPIGNYTSQYFGNYYLSEFDHWVKEQLHVKYYMRYMDDMIIFGSNKERLHDIFYQIEKYLYDNLKLTVKKNWQIFPVNARGVDFVGYRSFREYTLIRTETKKNYQKKVKIMVKRLEAGDELNESDQSTLASYSGLLQWGDCYRLKKKTLKTLDDFL